METESVGFKQRLSDIFTWIFALRITTAERLLIPADPMDIYVESVSHRKPRIVALILAAIFHFILFMIALPAINRDLVPTETVLQLKHLAKPAGGPPKIDPVPKKPKKTIKKKRKIIPIPDPTPQDPEPIIREVALSVPEVTDELSLDLNIGDITGPPSGAGDGPSDGVGSSNGAEGGIYTIGSGVTNPIVLYNPAPRYTDDAIKSKVQGTVLLQVVIRKDGSVDNFKVLRSLGYGLDENAIREIATNWKFRPGTYNGQSVDVLATIEVTFTLR